MSTIRHKRRLLFCLSVITIVLMACSLASPRPFEGPIATPTFPPIADNITITPGYPQVGATPTLPPSVTATPAPACSVSPKFGQDIRQWCPQIMKAVSKYPNLDPNWIAALIDYASGGQNVPPINRGDPVGLMRIMPSNGIDEALQKYFNQCRPGQKGSDQPYDFSCRPNSQELLQPDLNIDYGCALFSELLIRTNGDLSKALYYYGSSEAYAKSVINIIDSKKP